MNANEFFDKHSIEEINKKTRISPISLRYIKNREFDKIQRVKFLGFVKIIEKEYKIDLSELIEEYNQCVNPAKEAPAVQKETPKIENKKNSTFLISFLALILLILGGYLLYKTYNTNKTLPKNTFAIDKTELNETNNTNSTAVQSKKAQQPLKTAQTNITKTITPKKQKKHSIPKQVTIIPNNLLWFKAVNLDTNKTVQFLTSKPKTLKGTDWYLKMGHGNETIVYGDKNITPNTKKIVRILLKDGNVTYLKKPNRYEK